MKKIIEIDFKENYFENEKECPRKIRNKERNDVNEFWEWRLEKVTNYYLRSVDNNYDTRLDKIKSKYKLLEFLGLKDKNGQLIHFGDILIDECQNLLTPVVEIENDEHIFYFKPIKHLKTKLNMGCKSTYSNTLEIIGNIFTNKYEHNKYCKSDNLNI